jgi:phosphoheptose isomerase
VAMDADGDFVVAWQTPYLDEESYGIAARRFSSAGVAQAAEFQVNTYGPYGQSFPAVALDDDGDFVIAWQSFHQDESYFGVFARRFDAAGVPQATEFQVNSYTPQAQYRPAVDLDADGDFVIAWHSLDQDGASSGVFARRFSAAGVPQALEVQVNAYTTGSQRFPAVGLGSGGDFVISWESYQDGSLSGIFARRWSAAGVAVGAEFQVNSYTPSEQGRPDVAVDTGGSFVVSWASDNQDDGGYDGVFAQRFSAAGVPIDVEFQVNTYTPQHQSNPAVGADADGDFVVAWSSTGQDGSGDGVFAQRFATFAILDIDANGAVNPLTDGLLVLRFLFGFNNANLTAGAVDTVACTRCDAASIQGYLQTLI